MAKYNHDFFYFGSIPSNWCGHSVNTCVHLYGYVIWLENSKQNYLILIHIQCHLLPPSKKKNKKTKNNKASTTKNPTQTIWTNNHDPYYLGVINIFCHANLTIFLDPTSCMLLLFGLNQFISFEDINIKWDMMIMIYVIWIRIILNDVTFSNSCNRH